MLRSKDFYLKKVYNKEGKKIGIVEATYINFVTNRIVGFKIYSTNMIKRDIMFERIISFDETIIVEESEDVKGILFKTIKDIEIINELGNINGTVEDFICDNVGAIVGVVSSFGLVSDLLKGKQIFLINDCLLMKDKILYKGRANISFISMPHAI